jgi:Uma2 family endonuclease
MSVYCPEDDPPGPDDIAENPILIAEVLSPSTESYDRGFKFARYRTIQSLCVYLLVSQTEPQVEMFTRQPNGDWLLSIAQGLHAPLYVESLGCTIPLAGIYEKIVFAT